MLSTFLRHVSRINDAEAQDLYRTLGSSSTALTFYFSIMNIISSCESIKTTPK